MSDYLSESVEAVRPIAKTFLHASQTSFRLILSVFPLPLNFVRYQSRHLKLHQISNGHFLRVDDYHYPRLTNMADAPKGQPAAGTTRGGGFGSRGDRGGDRGRGRGRRGPRRGGNKSEEKEWQPVTKLGRLVKAGKIKSMEEIYLHSLPIKEYQIVDFFLPKLKDEVMKVSSGSRSGDYSHLATKYSRLQCSAGRLWLFVELWKHMLTCSSGVDQTRPKANARRSTHTIQGHRRHWGLGRACRSWD